MAYTKIIVIRGRLDKCLSYAANEEKTYLETAVDYALDRGKTERVCYETAINCGRDTAYQDMMQTARRWGKQNRVRKGYHVIQSFHPGEVTPEQAHTIGVELAQRLLGGRYEVVVATHLDRAHLHIRTGCGYYGENGDSAAASRRTHSASSSSLPHSGNRKFRKKEVGNMDAGSEAADLMVREGLQIAEATVKLLAAGSKNLAAFLYALAKDNKRVSGKTNMGRLLREGKELRVFQLRESDLAAFSAYAKKGILYAVVKDKNAGDGLVDLITNVDFASQVNLFLERHGYAAPKREDDAAKKADARAPQGNFSPQRGNGLPQERTTTEGKPSVKGRLAALKRAAQDVEPQLPNGRTPPKMRE